MIRLSGVMIAALAALAVLAAAVPLRSEPAQRVVSVGGAVTEIVYALGEQGRLVARDTTSNYPPEALALPDVGYIRRLSPEGVLSVAPDLILSEEGAGPPETVELLRQADIPFAEVPDGFTRDAILAKIAAVGDALSVPGKAEALAAKVGAELDTAVSGVTPSGRKVLFILSMQGGRIMAGGTDTAADAIIRLAGAENAARDFTGYKPLTDEAVTQAQPDVILMMDREGDHAAANAQLFAHPALATTPAAARDAVVRMDGMLLLGFSIRTPRAVRALAGALATHAEE
ncbi:heme/hemin ABC transporter substrate-binding protein [Pseudooceanicola sp.]|jgi:iron complex transport system substrate-binding protein|uniref:heme/hemin ABC transporter substrate-binding protein n=1 Tax=Pseudooceanicola sp. TaxID=1914328 RepID=UPI0040586D75